MWRVFMVVVFAVTSASAQKVEVVKFDRVEELMTAKSDKIQVINFWATWCGPCVEELPHFQSLELQDPSVQVTLVNLDYADKVNKVNSFVSKKKITSRVLLLDDIDYDAWIDRVDSSWGGAIPATLFINTTSGQRKFVERPLTPPELETLIKSLKSTN